MDEQTQAQLQRLKLRKLECQRHLRVLEQKLAANPRDVWTHREMERMQEQLAKLEAQEQRLLKQTSEQISVSGEDDGREKAEGENSGSR